MSSTLLFLQKSISASRRVAGMAAARTFSSSSLSTHIFGCIKKVNKLSFLSPRLHRGSSMRFASSIVNSSNTTYLEMYEESISDPSGFWARHARENITWRSDEFSHPVADVDLSKGHHAWFKGGKLNVTETLIDRHIASGNGDRVALIWESDEPGEGHSVTYSELHDNVCRLANALKARGVGPGDPVCLYMPMTTMAVYSMLACARLGAPHSIVFAGFSADALRSRIQNIGSRFVLTADEGVRGGKVIPLKAIVDEALVGCEDLVESVFVSARTGSKDVKMVEGRDIFMEQAMKAEVAVCEPEIMDAEDPLFYLYTSGSTGAPKGLQHSTAGYLVYAQMTHKHVFDYKDGDVFACVADVGWITGHTYVVYGPLANGATTVLFESIPTYPDAGRYWDMVERHGINQLYTAPTAIRLLIKNGDHYVTKYDRSSLRTLGTVGEPINPEAWKWYHEIVGESRCAVVDTWWQTETGGHMLTPLATDTDQKPGAAMRPFFGVEPALLDGITGEELQGNNQSGLLVMKGTPPGMSRTIFGDHERFLNTYYNYPGYYFSGDGAYRDEDGHYWITGRVDDVINVSGHRLGTAEVESALVSHESVAEAAVVGFPHEIKGEGIYAYVILKDGKSESDDLLKNLVQYVRKDIGPFASPEIIHVTADLPKTRSGKIMRRILRKVASKDFGDLGDVSTLAIPEVVEDLIQKREQL